MLIFKYPNKKVIIVTELRTGSTVLGNATTYSDLELFETYNTVLTDQLFQKLNTMQSQGWQIALCVKDPMERRRSALELISLRSDSTDLTQRAYYIRGLVTGVNINYHNIFENGYFSYTLNDGHLDWGTSCYYHLFVNQGIFPTLLYVDRGINSDWSYNKSHLSFDFTKFMLDLFDQDPSAQDQFSSDSNQYTERYNSKDILLPVSETEASRMYLYEIYKKTIEHSIYLKSWNNLQEDIYDKDVLRFSEWEDMEIQMYQHMIMMINSSQELRYNSSKIVIKHVLSRLIDCYGLEARPIPPMSMTIHHYPSKNFLMHIPDPLNYLNNLTKT